MTAKGILNAAYKARIVPEHLYGKTQYKTLQARLSEDILSHRSSSQFFRTEPGQFFLSELISDPKIPEKFKEPFPARRRTRDLQKELSLAIDKHYLASCDLNKFQGWVGLVENAEAAGALHYISTWVNSDNYATVWTFSLVRKESKVLSYRVGRYRDNRDTFANRRTVGFPGNVSIIDRTLFSKEDYGACENALSVILSDLDLSPQAFGGDDKINKPKPVFIMEAEGNSGNAVILLIMEWSCPDWFEPTTRRLSLNDPCWLDLAVMPNNLRDFEPWSLATIKVLLECANEE